MAAKPYDQLGIFAPLVAQMRKTVSLATIATKGIWESTVTDELWNLFATN